ncbi:MAG: hypothetical protein IKT40_00950 [Bacilli bacterium]|nr:hypothetical protein [Bacilli bacterium]
MKIKIKAEDLVYLNSFTAKINDNIQLSQICLEKINDKYFLIATDRYAMLGYRIPKCDITFENGETDEKTTFCFYLDKSCCIALNNTKDYVTIDTNNKTISINNINYGIQTLATPYTDFGLWLKDLANYQKDEEIGFVKYDIKQFKKFVYKGEDPAFKQISYRIALVEFQRVTNFFGLICSMHVNNNEIVYDNLKQHLEN